MTHNKFNGKLTRVNFIKTENSHMKSPLPTHLRFARKIKDIQYDQENKILKIEFASRIVKEYFNIPETLYEEFIHASDPIEIYNNKIDTKFSVK